MSFRMSLNEVNRGLFWVAPWRAYCFFFVYRDSLMKNCITVGDFSSTYLNYWLSAFNTCIGRGGGGQNPSPPIVSNCFVQRSAWCINL